MCVCVCKRARASVCESVLHHVSLINWTPITPPYPNTSSYPIASPYPITPPHHILFRVATHIGHRPTDRPVISSSCRGRRSQCRRWGWTRRKSGVRQARQWRWWEAGKKKQIHICFKPELWYENLLEERNKGSGTRTAERTLRKIIQTLAYKHCYCVYCALPPPSRALSGLTSAACPLCTHSNDSGAKATCDL